MLLDLLHLPGPGPGVHQWLGVEAATVRPPLVTGKSGALGGCGSKYIVRCSRRVSMQRPV